jgi:MerR family transcriptional regulator, light-induced transcriptional regulator
MQNINMKAVVQMTGINENTLRAWERRYQLVEPARSPDGRRLYSRKDIEKLMLVWELVQNGHLVGNLAQLSLTQLKKMSVSHLEAPESASSSSAEDVHLEAIVVALKRFDLDRIHQCLQQAKFELSPKAIITNLILPLLRNVGMSVLQSEMSIAQEHLLSSLLRDYLGNIYQSLSPYDYKSRPNGKKILITTREGDMHEFGILLAAILARIHGHETYYLGPNMPAADLAEACRHFEIDTVVLGMAALPEEKEIISPTEFLGLLDESIPKKATFLCGGSAQIGVPKLSSGRQFIFFASVQDLDAFLNRKKG